MPTTETSSPASAQTAAPRTVTPRTVTSRDATDTDDPRADNQVLLRGRLAAEPAVRVLPSGDELVSFRLTVRRPADDGDAKVRVDSIDCAVLAARPRRTVQRCTVGDMLELTGALRRRFWRSDAGLGSRYEVLVNTARISRRRRSDA